MKTDEKKEFYVGYLPRMPHALARFTTRLAAAMLLLAALLGVTVPFLHDRNADARSDFGDIRTFEGLLLSSPAPHIVILRPGETGNRAFSRYVLVGRGKSGPKIELDALAGKQVKLIGSLIYRDDQTYIAVKSAEAQAPIADPSAAVLHPGEDLGTFTLRGEIVDSKCYFGTMRPGNGSVHRTCAVRCIAGGVPPVFVIRDESGNTMSFLLVSSDGSSVNERIRSLIADPLEIRGRVTRLDDLFVLSADPAHYRRL